MSDNQEHWTKRAWQGVVLLVGIAVGARVVWGFLHPLIPLLTVLIGLAVVYGIAFRRWL